MGYKIHGAEGMLADLEWYVGRPAHCGRYTKHDLLGAFDVAHPEVHHVPVSAFNNKKVPMMGTLWTIAMELVTNTQAARLPLAQGLKNALNSAAGGDRPRAPRGWREYPNEDEGVYHEADPRRHPKRPRAEAPARRIHRGGRSSRRCSRRESRERRDFRR